MPYDVVQRITDGLNRLGWPVRDPTILLLALMDKHSPDARESPATRVIHLLRALGADVTAVDSYVARDHLEIKTRRIKLTAETVRAADGVAALTDHDLWTTTLSNVKKFG